VDALIKASVAPGHVFNNLHNDNFRLVKDCLLEVAEGAKIEIPMLVHRGNGLNSNIDIEAFPVVAGCFPEIIRDVRAAVLGNICPGISEDVPVASLETMTIRVFLHNIERG